LDEVDVDEEHLGPGEGRECCCATAEDSGVESSALVGCDESYSPDEMFLSDIELGVVSLGLFFRCWIR
jgi:hypothetical protein